MNEEFSSNLYAQIDGSVKDGAHTLSISDVYYRKYFKSNDKEKNEEISIVFFCNISICWLSKYCISNEKS